MPVRLALMLLLLALALSGPGHSAPIEYRATNQNLEEARKLVAKGRYEDALDELRTAEQLPGNTNRQRADLYALRATSLLALPPLPAWHEAAIEALVALAHVDPDGTALGTTSDAVRALAQQIRSERLLVLTDRLVTARSGRPLRIRARVVGAQVGAPQIFVNYRTEREEYDPKDPTPGFDEEYVRVPLEPAGASLYEVYLRPGVGGVPAGGEHVLRYFIEATGAGAALLDSNGTVQDPIRVQLSETKLEVAGVGGLAALDEGGKPAHPPPPPPPPKPWYKRWEIVGPVGGAVVVGVVVAAILLQPKPQAPSGSLGQVNLP